ncbi:hypothetical protein BS50DRAFT_674188 [Corynespora cassiicola Philippines]|uniref:Azaphilone pigments biosynthesis cluster protein L N-terminal domain-containing protein n=1 Tax=Corynespora cassiicola Philippines TaxID=1448308 RepID=A0A2T2NW17_CORCC|nr:hypothetical protein BS50DRAFT_674188 [Corynespora cassiicola Philippines]
MSFEIAGSAVGVVSLGIKLCEDLITYIGHVKDSKTEVSQISNQLEQLADILEKLQTISGEAGADATRLVDAGVAACATALQKIQNELPALNNDGADASVRASVRSWRRRLAYPFLKREELFTLKAVLENIQLNLNTALHALQIELQQKSHRNVIARIDRLSHSTDQAGLTTQNGVDRIEIGISNLTSTVHPMAVDMHALSQRFEQMMLSMERMEATIQSRQPDNYPAAIIQRDAYRMGRLQRRANLTRQNGNSCRCRPRSTTESILGSWFQWPVSFSEQKTQLHEIYCPLHRLCETEKNFITRFTMCSAVFKTKFQLSINLAFASRGFSITSSLRCIRIVESTSPGFEFIDTIFHSNEIKQDGGDLSQKLLMLFEQREATPHDRLADGRTLLHHLFGVYIHFSREIAGQHLLPFIQTLASLMGPLIHEQDEQKLTCLDYILLNHSMLDIVSLEQIYQPDIEEYEEGRIPLTQICLEFGIKSGGIDILPLGEIIPVWQKSKFDWSDIDDFPPLLIAILEKSLGKILDLSDIPGIFEELLFGYSPLEVATIVGWEKGCEVFLECSKLLCGWCPSILIAAVESKDPKILKFWINKRKSAEPKLLENIGFLEDALESATMSAAPFEMVFETISAIICQRNHIFCLAKEKLPAFERRFKTDRLPDAECKLILNTLQEEGIHIPKWLYPRLPSKYVKKDIFLGSGPKYLGIYSYQVFASYPRLADFMFQAGFKDISAKDFLGYCPQEVPSSLLVYHSGYRDLDACFWLISRGISPMERCINFGFAAISILSVRLGIELCFALDQFTIQSANFECESYSIYRILDLLREYLDEHILDSCLCPCNESGCSFVSIVVKVIDTYFTEKWSVNSSERDAMIFLGYLLILAPFARQSRQTVTDMIRAFTFSALDLQHTCCALERFKYIPIRLFNPRFTPKKLREIKQEDGFLRQRLEELVVRFESEYESQGIDVVDFFMIHWQGCMEEELQRLELDDAQYEPGRRELGVVMEATDAESENGYFVDEEWLEKSKGRLKRCIPVAETVEELRKYSSR